MFVFLFLTFFFKEMQFFLDVECLKTNSCGRVFNPSPWECLWNTYCTQSTLVGAVKTHWTFSFWWHHAAYWPLVPQPEIEPVSPAGEVGSHYHWATEEVPGCCKDRKVAEKWPKPSTVGRRWNSLTCEGWKKQVELNQHFLTLAAPQTHLEKFRKHCGLGLATELLF